MNARDLAEPLPDDGEEEESWLRHVARVSEVDPVAELPRPGELIDGRYQIEELIGRGGMGAVFRAKHVRSHEPIAIKCMLRPASDDHARRRLLREARAVGRIDHPNVVVLYDVCQAGDRIYLVMELLRGESLRARLGRGRLEVTTAIDLLLPAMNGVAAAHRAGVIHRDLKPDNVFLCDAADGGPPLAKVLDFGISSIRAAVPGNSTLTQNGALLGSPAYMSPEQIKNPHAVDQRTDVYAAGVTLYEVLAGFRPFQSENHAGLIAAITNEDPKPLSRARAGLPAGLEDVVLQALSRVPAARHQTMETLTEALRPFGTPRHGVWRARRQTRVAQRIARVRSTRVQRTSAARPVSSHPDVRPDTIEPVTPPRPRTPRPATTASSPVSTRKRQTTVTALMDQRLKRV